MLGDEFSGSFFVLIIVQPKKKKSVHVTFASLLVMIQVSWGFVAGPAITNLEQRRNPFRMNLLHLLVQ
jgi:hypothetical protein